MSSSRRDARTNCAPKWEDLERSVEPTHNAIVDAIKVFKALPGCNYAVFEQIATNAEILNSARSNEVDRSNCRSNIRRLIRSLAEENDLDVLPAISNDQIQTVARMLQTRQQLIFEYVERLLPHICDKEENKSAARTAHHQLLNENLNAALKELFEV
jgi:hypothetical protein